VRLAPLRRSGAGSNVPVGDTAPFRLSILATAGHLSVLCGRQERGFVLEAGQGPTPSGKWLETWRNAHCGSLNVAALGMRLVVDSGRAVAAA